MKGADTEDGSAGVLSESEDLRVHGEPSLVGTPIFVVGCPRSGTTILRWSLDSHPRISAGPEESALLLPLESRQCQGSRTARGLRGRRRVLVMPWSEDLVNGLMRPYAESQGEDTMGPQASGARVSRSRSSTRFIRNARSSISCGIPADVVASCQRSVRALAERTATESSGTSTVRRSKSATGRSSVRIAS